MRFHRQGGIWFWQAGRFGGSLYRKRHTLAQAALRHLRRERRMETLVEVGVALNLGLLSVIVAQQILALY